MHLLNLIDLLIIFHYFRLAEEPYKCINNTCQLPESHEGFEEFVSPIPSFYTKAGPRKGDYYYISDEELPWTQAQYECQSRKGHLAEVTPKVGRFPEDLIRILRREIPTINGTSSEGLWVGASDLFQQGKFVWYNNDKDVDDNNWNDKGQPKDNSKKDQRCLKLINNGEWMSDSCELRSRFICQYDASIDL